MEEPKLNSYYKNTICVSEHVRTSSPGKSRSLIREKSVPFALRSDFNLRYKEATDWFLCNPGIVAAWRHFEN